MAGALDGILVADFSRVLAGPVATMILGDLGADVIKVERPGTGDDTRAWGPPWAPDGESLLLPRRQPEQAERGAGSGGSGRPWRPPATLALDSDVVVENFRPGVMARQVWTTTTLAAVRPDLVSCRIAGLGRGDVAGYDFLAQAVGGLMSITGDAGGEPHKVGVALVDVMAGLHAAIGILAALRHRDRTGEGQLVEVDLLSTTLFALANQASNWLTAGVVPGRMGNRHPSIAPYEMLAAADGPFVIAVGNDAQFATFCDVRRRARRSPRTNASRRTPARVTNRDELLACARGRAAPAPSPPTGSRVSTRAGIPCGMVNHVDQAFALARVGRPRTRRRRSPRDGTVVRPRRTRWRCPRRRSRTGSAAGDRRTRRGDPCLARTRGRRWLTRRLRTPADDA